jgi:hypothetical protein
MRGETVAQRVRVDDSLEGGLLRRTFAGMVDRLGRYGTIAGVSIPARKQPYADRNEPSVMETADTIPRSKLRSNWKA